MSRTVCRLCLDNSLVFLQQWLRVYFLVPSLRNSLSGFTSGVSVPRRVPGSEQGSGGGMEKGVFFPFLQILTPIPPNQSPHLKSKNILRGSRCPLELPHPFLQTYPSPEDSGGNTVGSRFLGPTLSPVTLTPWTVRGTRGRRSMDTRDSLRVGDLPSLGVGWDGRRGPTVVS